MLDFYHTREVPLLVVHGDLDAFTNYDLNARRTFERASPNAHLVTLAKGTHAAFAIQLDAGTLALMNNVLGPPGSDPTNPDAFGCGAAGPELSSEGHTFLEPLGGMESFVQYDREGEPNLPFTGDEYTLPALDAYEQVELAAQATVAFFDAHLGGTVEAQRNGCHYLMSTLPEHPAVTVE